MSESKNTIAQEIAQAAMDFQAKCTGVAPDSVTVLLCDESLVVTLHEALSPAEKDLARTPEGAAKVHERHRQLFLKSAGSLHAQIKRILGVEVRESTVELEPATGRVVEVFPSGALIQVFRLGKRLGSQTWSSPRRGTVSAAIQDLQRKAVLP